NQSFRPSSATGGNISASNLNFRKPQEFPCKRVRLGRHRRSRAGRKMLEESRVATQLPLDGRRTRVPPDSPTKRHRLHLHTYTHGLMLMVESRPPSHQ